MARAHLLKPDERFDREAIIQFLATQGVHGYTAPTNAELLAKLVANTRAETARPQLVVFFTNGTFDGIITGFVQQAGGVEPPCERAPTAGGMKGRRSGMMRPPRVPGCMCCRTEASGARKI